MVVRPKPFYESWMNEDDLLRRALEPTVYLKYRFRYYDEPEWDKFDNLEHWTGEFVR